MKIALVLGILLLSAGSLRARPREVAVLPETPGIFAVRGEVLRRSEQGGIVRIGEREVSVSGVLPSPGTTIEGFLTQEAGVRRLRVTGTEAPHRFDLNHLSTTPLPGTQVLAFTTPTGIRVGEIFHEIPHRHRPGEWVVASVHRTGLEVQETLRWNGDQLAGLTSTTSTPTHVDNGVWR